jgi:Leucine-rich repeat (LRR) protein
LQYLNLNRSSHISTLPDSIGKLGSLRYLGLSGCSGISNLPESFSNLKCTVHLDMSGCSGIRELPASIGNLTNLQHLDLSKCSSAKSIPESLCSLSRLRNLNLSSCGCITRLPEAIGSLVNLQYLYMSSSGVREFPESFNRLHSLLHLDLNKCYIEKGLAGALHGLTALQYLDMSHVKCARDFETEELPVVMRNLTNLKVLELENCICGPFVACTNLYFIGTLTNLQKLNLSGNWFEHLPESIGNLKRLHTLNLTCSSKLKSLPNSIGGATGLKSVLLDGCSQELVDQASSHDRYHYLMSNLMTSMHYRSRYHYEISVALFSVVTTI